MRERRSILAPWLLLPLLCAGCVSGHIRQAPFATCKHVAVATPEAAIRVAERAAEIENPDAFRFDVTSNEDPAVFFVMVFEKDKADEFYVQVTVDACDGSTQLHGPL
jgi:hypothetical protein